MSAGSLMDFISADPEDPTAHDGIKHHCVRYYRTPPEEKTLKDCYSHGSDHKAYGWYPGVDPRWSQEQREAYCRGYDETRRD